MSSRLKKMGNKRPNAGLLEIRNRKDFERQVIDSELPVIVDFWAPWCQPCKMQGPVFEAVAKEWEGKVRFVKLNTEANSGVARELQISSIPTILAFDGGEVVDARIGLTAAGQLDAFAKRVLDKHDGVTMTQRIKRFFGSGEAAAQ